MFLAASHTVAINFRIGLDVLLGGSTSLLCFEVSVSARLSHMEKYRDPLGIWSRIKDSNFIRPFLLTSPFLYHQLIKGL